MTSTRSWHTTPAEKREREEVGLHIIMRRSGNSFSSGAAERLINARSGTSDAEVTVSKPSAQLLQNNTNQLDSRISSVSSIESIGLSADVVPAHMHRSPTMSPRLTYLRTLSNRMVSAGLNPLEPPPGLVEPPTFFPPVRMTFGSMPDLANKANSMGIVFTVWNTMMGSTLLVMPYTFNEAGWLLALILSVVCAATMRYTGGLILYYAEGLMADPAAEFADLARLHFGRAGHLLAFATGNFVVLAAAVDGRGIAPEKGGQGRQSLRREPLRLVDLAPVVDAIVGAPDARHPLV